jgi:hypothetical protein
MSAARGQGRRCTFERPDGTVCRAWAVKDSEPALCFLHQGDAEERRARARKAANASAYVRRGRTEPLPQSDLHTGLTIADLYKPLSEALVATNEIGHPDWSARLAACAVLVLAAPRHYRRTPEDAKRLLAAMLPREAGVDAKQLNVERAFKALREEWWSLPAVHPVRGLVARDLPRQFVPPWQDYSDVVKAEAPKNVPLAEANVFRLPDGTLALRRPGQLPLALEEAEDDGGLIRAVVNLR